MNAPRPFRYFHSILVALFLSLLVLVLAMPVIAEVEVITITASGREASSQDVPIAVTALSAEMLERQGVTDIRSLVALAPSLSVNSSNTETGGSTIRLRGVGTTGNNAGLEGSVGVFLDGTYLSRPGIAFGSLVDIERVEVLRGPQGTLFGRNTSAGAIVLKTRMPSFDGVENRVDLSYGSYNDVVTSVITNLPVIEDTLALRFTGSYHSNDGFVKSVARETDSGKSIISNDRNRYLLRGQALWQISDDATLRLIGDYFDAEEKCCDAPIRNESGLITTLFGTPFGIPFGGNNGVNGNFGTNALEDRRTNVNRERQNDQDQWGLSGELNWDQDWGNVTYIGSYRDWDSTQAGDDDFTSNDIINTRSSPQGIETVSSELRIQGEWEWLDWLVGGYYIHEEIRTEGHLGLGTQYEDYANLLLGGLSGGALSTSVITGVAPGSNFVGTVGNNLFSQNANSYSLFTHNIVDVGQFIGMEDRLHFTGGFRYTWENKDGQFKLGDPMNPGCDGLISSTRAGGGLNVTGALSGTAAAVICFPFVSSGVPQFNQSFKDDQPSGTAKFSFDFTEDIMGYVSYSRGFKAGGFNLDSTAAIRNGLSAATIPVNPANDALPGNFRQVGDASFDSETVNAYELGLKTELWGNRIRANGSWFYYDIEDFQVLEFTGVSFVTENVPSATVHGFEFESTTQLFDGFELLASFTYSDAKYSDDGCVPNANSSTLFGRICGLKLTNAPPWVVNLGLVYTTALFESSLLNLPEFMGVGDIMGSLYFNWQFRDDRRAGTTSGGVSAAPGGSEALGARVQERTETIDMRFALHSEDYSWSAEVWGRNLTDERSSSVLFAIPLRTGATGGFLDPPRMFGFTVRAVF